MDCKKIRVICMNFDEDIKKRRATKLYTVCSFCNKEYTFNQYLECKSFWIDPMKKEYGKMSLCECVVDLFVARWEVMSKLDVYDISTRHLAIAHSGVEMNDWFDYNFWYETIFWREQPGVKKEWGDFQIRYHTRKEAIIGHKFVVENLNKIIEHPERFPQSILSKLYNEISAEQDQKKNIDPHDKRNLT